MGLAESTGLSLSIVLDFTKHIHKIQIGIVLDRVFFLRMAEEKISLEDIRDVDPSLYSSCKKILEMDLEMVDEDILSLTFICDVEEFGSKITVDLCPNGEDTVVNNKNRKNFDQMLDGSGSDISVKEWRAHIDYNGYKESDHQIS